jgi:hypothetical protein
MVHLDPGPPEATWTLGPISIKRTTDILALVAFILSIVGLLAQARDYLRGSNVVLFRSEQVTFGSSKALKVYFQNNDQFLLVTAIMSYVNDAPAGFNAAVGREYVRLYLDGKKYQYSAHQTVSTSSESSVLNVVKKDDSGPFAVNSGSAVSHEVLFEPHPVKCVRDDEDCAGSLPAIRWDEFKLAVKKSPTIVVDLLADVYGKATLSVRCLITLNPNDLAAFDNNNQEWSAPDCGEEPKKGFWERVFGRTNGALPAKNPGK